MTLQGQLAQSHGTMPNMPFFASMQPFETTNALLGNAYIQTRAIDVDTVIEQYLTLFNGADPSKRLSILKRQKFKELGKEARITASLAALNAQQPTELTLAQWETILDEDEEED